MRTAISNSLIGSKSAYATLTGVYTGNRTNPIAAKNIRDLTLEVHYIPGANNQYVEINLEVSNSDALPSAAADWVVYPSQITSPTELAAYDIPIVIPGDKISVASTEEYFAAALEMAYLWFRISIREKTSSGDTPTAFGSIHLRFAGVEDIF